MYLKRILCNLKFPTNSIHEFDSGEWPDPRVWPREKQMRMIHENDSQDPRDPHDLAHS